MSASRFDKMATTGISLSLPTQIKANMDKIKSKLKATGIINDKSGYIAKKELLPAQDADIIKYYKSLAHGLLSYYRCADNLGKIKDLIMYQLRFSLAATLRTKHKMGQREFMERYGEPITSTDYQGKKVTFLNNMQVYNVRKEFLKSVNPNPFQNLHKITVRVSNSTINQGVCSVQGCTSTDIQIHHIRQLHKRTKEGKGFTVITSGKTKRISGLLAIESALRRKQIPLCKQHHIAWHKKEIKPENLLEQYSRN